MKLFKALILFTLGILPVATQAQQVSYCGWQASAAAIAEPWEENTRVFANGAVRLALLDTVEPAAAALHILIISPPYDELGIPQCKVVSRTETLGFMNIEFSMLEAAYDPSRGLVFQVPGARYPEDHTEPEPILIEFTLNQATGEITAATYDAWE